MHMSKLQDEIEKSVAEHTQTVVQAFMARMSQHHTDHIVKTTKTAFMSQVELEHFQSHFREAYEQLEIVYRDFQASLKTELDTVKLSLDKTTESCRLELQDNRREMETLRGCTVRGEDWKGDVESRLRPFIVSWEQKLMEVKS